MKKKIPNSKNEAEERHFSPSASNPNFMPLAEILNFSPRPFRVPLKVKLLFSHYGIYDRREKRRYILIKKEVIRKSPNIEVILHAAVSKSESYHQCPALDDAVPEANI
jgi:hypothetical protein